MRSILLTLLVFAAPPAPANPLLLVHVSDTHETLSEVVDDRSGARSLYLSRTAARVDRLRAERPDAEVLVVHAGDWIAPSIASRSLLGQDVIARLNELGVGLAAVGNHDFDLGREAFDRAVASARFPVINANVTRAGDGARVFPTHHVHVTRDGRRIAFVSVVTGDLQRVIDKFDLGLRVESFESHLGEIVRRLKREKTADFVVALTHLERAEDHAVIQAVPEIDLTLGGHEHELYEEHVDDRLLVKAGADGTSLNVVEIDFDVVPPRIDVRAERLTKESPRATSMRRLEEATLESLEINRAEIVGQLGRDLDGTWKTLQAEGVRTSPHLGTWIANVMRRGLGADATLMNVGLVSRSNRIYPPGPLTRGDLEDMLPWIDPMIVVETDRPSLLRVLEEMLEKTKGHVWSGDTPVFAGIDARWSMEGDYGRRVELAPGPQTLNLAINLYLFRAMEAHLAVRGFVRPPGEALPEMEAVREGLRRCETNLE